MQKTVIYFIVSGSLSIILNWRVEGKGRTVCRSLGQSSVSLIFSRSLPSCVGSGQGQKRKSFRISKKSSMTRM
jgi:hypothetical protein